MDKWNIKDKNKNTVLEFNEGKREFMKIVLGEASGGCNTFNAVPRLKFPTLRKVG